MYSYRNTPHTTTRITLSSLGIKNLRNTKFSLLKPSFGETQWWHQDSSSETKRNFEPEDTVLIFNTRNGTESRWREGTVTQRHGPVSYVVCCGEQNRRVHSDHMRLLRCKLSPHLRLILLSSDLALNLMFLLLLLIVPVNALLQVLNHSVVLTLPMLYLMHLSHLCLPHVLQMLLLHPIWMSPSLFVARLVCVKPLHGKIEEI